MKIKKINLLDIVKIRRNTAQKTFRSWPKKLREWCVHHYWGARTMCLFYHAAHLADVTQGQTKYREFTVCL